MAFVRLVWVMLLVPGCDAAVGPDYEQCELDLVLSADSGVPGDIVSATGRPLTADFDTVVRVGGVEAAILLVDREECEACDICRSEAGCNQCVTCATCAETCAVCAEQVQFEVPSVDPGDAPVLVANGYGASLPLSFEVREPTR
jgi:hypothetical protein